MSPDSGRLHGKHAKENKLHSRLLLLGIYPDSPVYTSPKYAAYSNLSSYALTLPE